MERHTLSGASDPNVRTGQTQISTTTLNQPVASSALPAGRVVNGADLRYQQQAQQPRYDVRGAVGTDPRVAAANKSVGFVQPPQQQPLVAAVAAAAAAVAHVQHVTYQSQAGPGAIANAAARNAADARRSAQVRTVTSVRNASPSRSASVSATAAAIAADDKARAAAAAAAARKYASAVNASRAPQAVPQQPASPPNLVQPPLVNNPQTMTAFTPAPTTLPVGPGAIHSVTTATNPTVNVMSSGGVGTVATGSAPGPGAAVNSTSTSPNGNSATQRFQPIMSTSHGSSGTVVAPSAGAGGAVTLTGPQQQHQQTQQIHQQQQQQPTGYFNAGGGQPSGAAQVYSQQQFAVSSGSYGHATVATTAPPSAVQPPMPVQWDGSHGNTVNMSGMPGSTSTGNTGAGSGGLINVGGASDNATMGPSSGGQSSSMSQPIPSVSSAGPTSSSLQPTPSVSPAGPTSSSTPAISSTSPVPVAGSTHPGVTVSSASDSGLPPGNAPNIGIGRSNMQEREPLITQDAYGQPGAPGGMPPTGGYSTSSPAYASTAASVQVTQMSSQVGVPPSAVSDIAGTPGEMSGSLASAASTPGAGPLRREFHEQMSPSALQAIKQISKVRPTFALFFIVLS